jgi:hypothetical protein
MDIRGLGLEDFQAIVAYVSKGEYDGNVVVERNAHATGGRSCAARLWATDGYGPGARTSWTGRHAHAACWHAYRDVLAELFERFPKATVRTALAVYRGREGFERHYPATAYVNVGSQMQPAHMPELCDC